MPDYGRRMVAPVKLRKQPEYGFGLQAGTNSVPHSFVFPGISSDSIRWGVGRKGGKAATLTRSPTASPATRSSVATGNSRSKSSSGCDLAQIAHQCVDAAQAGVPRKHEPR